jgi:hypothetical protein
MKYLEKTIWDKKIPSFFGIGVFVLSIGVITWLTGNVILFGTKAATGATPKQVTITNITDHSFTVTYVTDSLVLGSVSSGIDSKFGTLTLDERDLAATSPIPHHVHSIQVQNLTPTTHFFFAIISDGEKYLLQNKPYEVSTASKQTSLNTNMASGQVSLASGAAPAEGLVYLSNTDSQIISTLLQVDGSYKLPVGTILKKDLTGPLITSPDTLLQIKAVTSTEQASATVLAGQVNPIPRLALSNTYDFTVASSDGDASINATGSATPDASHSASLPLPSTAPVSAPVILFPKDNAELKDPQPTFTGKALPNTSIDLTISSENTISQSLLSDSDGNWEYKPPNPLTPGVYTITAASVNAQGEVENVARSFTVNASGSKFAQPSVGPKNLTPSPIELPTATPTASPSPTLVLTSTPPITPTPFGGGNGNGNGNGDGSAFGPTIVPTGNSTAIYGGIAVGIIFIVGTILVVMTMSL